MAAITVTAAESGTTFPGVLLQVKVLTQATVAASPATAVQSSSVAAAHQASITTTAAGSLVYCAAVSSGVSSYVANGNTTLFTDHSDGPNSLETASGRQTTATGTPGAITIGFSSPVTPGGVACAEILAAGTITEDASSPAAAYGTGTTVTTASFNPPQGCVLVAMTAADASTATVVTVSDSSGLVWTAQAVAQTTGALYAAVWTAVIPAAPAAPPTVLYSMRFMP